MENSSIGPTRRKSQRSSSTPYARPSDGDKKKSLLHKVGESVVELLTPSWLSSFMTKSPEKADEGLVQTGADNQAGGSSGRAGSGVLSGSQAYPGFPSASSQHTLGTSVSSPHQLQRQPLSQVTQVAGPVSRSQYLINEDTVPILPMSQSVSMSQSATMPQSVSQSNQFSMMMSQSQRQLQPGHQRHNSGQLTTSEQQGNGYAAAAVERQHSKRHNSYYDNSPPGNKPPSKRANLSTSLLNESTAADRSSFNISSFAKSFSETMDGSILNSKNLNSSSYYPGKTTYGGISSKRSFTLPTASPYQRVDRATTRRNTPTSKKSSEKSVVPTSKAAKLIMKALDQTGVDPVENPMKSKVFSPAIYLRKKEMNSDKFSINAPPLKQMPKSAPVKLTPNFHKADVSSSSSDSSDSSVTVEQSSTPKAAVVGGKLKRDRGQGHYSNKITAEEETVEAPKLSTQFTLNMSNMPKIDFGFSPTSTASATQAAFSFSSPVTLTETNMSPSKASVSPTLGSFSFRSPGDAQNTQLSKLNPSAAAFVPKLGTSNVRVQSGQPKKDAVKPAPQVASGWGDIFKSQSEKWSCPDCLIQNDKSAAKCAACGKQNPSSSPAVAAKLPAASSTASSGWGNLFAGAAPKWSCGMCLTQNDMDKKDCAACGTKNPTSYSSSEVKATPKPVSQGFGDLFKSMAEKWSCSVCLVKNDKDKTECVTCNAKRHSSDSSMTSSTAQPTAVSTTPAPSTGSGWGNLFQGAAKKWSCPDCLIQNDIDAPACAACGHKNPSGEPPAASQPVLSAPEPAVTSGWGNMFKMPEGQWNCEACRISNPADKDVCVACTTPKPSKSVTVSKTVADLTGTAAAGWSKAGSPSSKLTGSWGSSLTSTTKWKCSSCFVQNNSSVSLCACCGACKPGTQSSLGDLSKGKQLPEYKAKKADTALIFGTPKLAGSQATTTASPAVSVTGSNTAQALSSSIFGSVKPTPTTKAQSSTETKPPSSVGTAQGLSSAIFGSVKPAATTGQTKSAKGLPTNSLMFPTLPTMSKTADKPAVSTEKVTQPVSSTSAPVNVMFGGAPPANPAPKTGLFSFGKAVDTKAAETAKKEEATPKTALFSFGTAQPESGDKPAASTSLFGTSKPAVKPTEGSQPAASPFSFKPSVPASGQATQTSSASILTSTIPSSPTTRKRPSEAHSTEAKKPSDTTTSSGSIFGAVNPGQQATAGFNFGAPAATATPTFQFGSGSAAPAGGLFGSNVKVSSAPTFGAANNGSSLFGSGSMNSFGGGQSTSTPAPVFGSQAVSTAAPVFGSSSQPSQSGLFGSGAKSSGLFGSSTPASSTSAPVFGSGSQPVFGSAAPASGGLFQGFAGSGDLFGAKPVQASNPTDTSASAPAGGGAFSVGSSQPARTMKKAVRRIKK